IVSKARLDLPLPDSPVITISLSRGRSISMPLRLCSRAPLTLMWVNILRMLAEIWGKKRKTVSCACFAEDGDESPVSQYTGLCSSYVLYAREFSPHKP